MNKRIILSLVLLALSTVGFAQEELSCAEKLSEAQRRFEQGRFYSIPKLLEDCVKRGLNDQQKIDAYFLLSQTYLFIDEPLMAEDAYLSILKINPEFKPDEERAPIDQVYLSEKFTTRPIFIASGRFGLNYTSVDVIQEFNTSPTPTVADYNLAIGVEASGAIDVVFSDFMSISAELGIVQKTYKFSQTLFDGDPQFMKEPQWNLEVPVLAKFRWDRGKITPILFGGAGLNYTLGATADLELVDKRVDDNAQGGSEVSINGQSVNLIPQRERLSWNIIVGGGVRIKSGLNYLSIDLRYRAGLTNIVNKQGHFQNDELVFRYAYVDDYKTLNNFVLSVGYVKPFYKPRKKRKYRK